MAEKSKTEKLQGRDFVVIGIFGLLYAIAQFAVAAIGAISVVGWLFYAVLAAFPCGIIFMYVIAKVPKRGAISLMIILTAILYFLVGTYGLWTPLLGAIGGIIADLIAGTGRYKKFWRNAFAFVVALTVFWFGFMQPVLFTTEQFIETALESGMHLDQVQSVVDFINGSGFYIGLITTIIAGVLGALLGKRVLRKHFEKAGIV